jgi:hypothetical protein
MVNLRLVFTNAAKQVDMAAYVLTDRAVVEALRQRAVVLGLSEGTRPPSRAPAS